ncbi:helix-turn-helix transcriptional regulator [Clostridium grantii]|uniref:Helix-turn-helix domain-containing protein n=1 Tax=Clostridium grantii DSM 8605 TaxID=1121316 RepID=A0A1M5UXH6_9CLOT|nr:AraC family transcriptional regulator [Clostridium grantii]SHH67659.1 Helix-turn-helix domain-containing protein [Clostridium grantii DSM 8605]
MHKKISTDKIHINEISPRLLTCYLINLKNKSEESDPRYVFDYEIEFIIESEGMMYINGDFVDIPANSIVFRRPGDYTYGIYPYKCYMIAIDLKNNTNKSSTDYNIYNPQSFQPIYQHEFLDSIPRVLKCSNPKLFEHYFSEILDAFIKNDLYSEIQIKAIIIQILYNLFKESKSSLYNNFNTINSPYNLKLKKVLNYIENNLDQPLPLLELSNLINLSPWYFQKIFKKYLGISPNKYILNKKISLAKNLLIHTDNSIENIALKCGFKNAPHFSTSFKKNVTLTPSEFRNKITQYF